MSPTPQYQSQRQPPQHAGRPAGRERDQRSSQSTIDTSRIRFGEEIDPLLYADIAQQTAQAIAGAGKREQNKSTQLRRFYDELILWNEKINGSGNAEERAHRYAELVPLVKMLKAKVTYAKGRGHVDENFETLFCHVIDAIRDAKTLEQAKLFMEAFMGFYKATAKG
ncbi:MAG: type III-A CRISPR-associated protein Csm2 [Rhodocyclaceae bacterium]|nr:type III-A CRISPR-associated protein Csm2 [Rhodocyclaceae bacterium]